MTCRPEEDTAGAEAVDFKREEVFIMPGLDGTGPMGAGPMTGGGWGLCNPSWRSYARPVFGGGRGFSGGFRPGFVQGWGFGRGLGWRGAYPLTGRWYVPAYNPPYGSPYTMKPEDEVNMLRDEADAVKNELDAINKRIKELESQSSTS